MAPFLQRVLLCSSALLAPAISVTVESARRTLLTAWSAEVDRASSASADGPTPIQRVVKLLNEMKAELDKEAQADRDTFAKLECWCDTNEKAKTKAIEEADATMNELMSQVQSLAARNAESGVKIEALKKDIAQKEEGLKQLVAIREKERAEFDKNESELTQSVAVLKNAISVLSKRQAGLLQVTPAVQASMDSALRWVALKHAELQDVRQGEGGSESPKRAALLTMAAGSGEASAEQASALQALREPGTGSSELPVEFALKVLSMAVTSAPSMLQQVPAAPPSMRQSYSPRSGQIFGILNQMLEDFSLDLSESQKAELKAREEFTALKAASEEQLEADKESLDELEEEHSTNIKALSDAKEDLELTRQQRAEDVKFLTDLKVTCKDLDYQFEQRMKARTEEIRAVADAIAIITEDDSRELLARKVGAGAASLLQVGAEGAAMRARRSRAASALLRAARQMPGAYQVWRSSEDRPHDQLAAVAVQVQLDAFAQVKKAIDDMVKSLKEQQVEEVKHKAYCVDELGKNEKQTYKTERLVEDLKDKVAQLEEVIQKLVDGIEAAQEEIARLAVEVKKASEAREKENKAFQEEVMDQRAVQSILKKAIDRLSQVYKKEALLQDAQTPPAQFQPYKQHQGGSKVIALIETVISDSVTVEKEAMAAEQEAQKAYESFVNDSTESTRSLQEAIVSKTKAKAEAEEKKAEVESQLASAQTLLEELAQQLADLHLDCDFLLKNFDIRQSARTQEIEALQQAKAYLAGMVDDDPLDQ